MRAVVDRYITIVSGTAWGLSVVGMVGLVLLSSSIVADVVMRYFFNSPITGVRDMLELFIAVCIGLLMPVLLLKEGNISVSFIVVLVGRRIGALLGAFANIVTLVTFVLIANELWKAANYLARYNEVTPILGVPLGPWWMCVAASMLFAAAAAVVPVLRGLAEFVNPALIAEKENKEPAR